MSGESAQLFWTFAVFIIMLFAVGFYCMIVTRNLIKALIGIEILAKAVTLLFIIVGYTTKRQALVQSFVITTIVIEVIVIVVAAGVILSIFRHQESLDARSLRELKG